MKTMILDILTTLYSYLGFSILLAFFFVYFYIYIQKNGKKAIFKWLKKKEYREIFIFALFATLILFRTLLNRNFYLNPLENIWGGWLPNEDGFENIFLFIPLSFLMGYVFHKNIPQAILYSFLFSLAIESSQLFFRLGTFQISDLTLNTLGGIIGILLYSLFKIKTPS